MRYAFNTGRTKEHDHIPRTPWRDVLHDNGEIGGDATGYIFSNPRQSA